MSSQNKAFTLLELLTAVALLALLLLVVSSIMNHTRTVTSSSRRHIDSDAEARMVFDRMARDFARMVKRTDVDYLISKQNGNDRLFFYSEAPAFSSAASTDQNAVALVGYRVNSSFQLERLGKGLTWDGATSDGVVFLTYANYPVTSSSVPTAGSTLADAFSSVVSPASTDSNYHVFGPNIFRFEVCFLLKSYKQANGTVLPAIYSDKPYDDARAGHSSLNGIGLEDVQAIVVTLAILDEDSKKILPDGTDFSAAVAALPDPNGTSGSSMPLPASVWQERIDSGAFSQASGIPQAAAKHVRVYQRIFEITTPNS